MTIVTRIKPERESEVVVDVVAVRSLTARTPLCFPPEGNLRGKEEPLPGWLPPELLQ